MQTTSQAYKDAVYAPVRFIAGQVTFDISDVTANGDITSVTTTAEAAGISDAAGQIADKVRTQAYSFGTLEDGRFRLDGSMSFPDSTLANNGECGFVSSTLSDSSGVFSAPQTITIVFGGTHSSAGLTVTFDKLAGEYATDFTVTAYDASDSVIQTVTVTGNTDVKAQPMGQLANYKKLVLSISKWSRPYGRARVVEIDFGVIQEYGDGSNGTGELISLNIVEEMRLTSDDMPAPELTFTVNNQDKAFNILNPTGFYAFLQQRQIITVALGIGLNNGASFEYVNMGTYLLRTWKSDQNALTATFTARPLIDTMDDFDYEQQTAQSTNLKALAESLFATCGIPAENYSVDAALASITTNAIADKTTCKNVLQMIAIAGRCRVYTTRSGVITLKQDLSYSVPAEQDTILLEAAKDVPKITLEPETSTVAVNYWTNATTQATYEHNVSTVTSGQRFRIDSNKLINTAAQAQLVAEWIAGWKNAARYKWEANWRGNPAHELSDSVAVENTFDTVPKAFITKQRIDYKGSLAAITELQGGAS